MRNFTSLLAFIFIFFLPVYSFAAPGNDACNNASPLTPGTTCSNTRGNLYQATNEGTVTSTCGTTSDVWYTFTVPSNAALTTITVDMDNGNTATNANSYLEVFNANSCASVSTATSLGCSGTGSATNFTLAPGTYYCRVFTTASTTGNSGKYGFNICVTYTPVPANDECTGAVSLTSNTNCSNTASTLLYATKSSGIPAGCAPAGNLYDVWYSFVATSTAQIVTLSGLGTGITSPSIQLFSGNCGALTSVACGTTSVASGNLVIGNTYYVQVSNSGTRVTSSGNFSICVTAPTPAKVDYSKSYVNISKGTTGGTVDPGDTLEMRFTLVVSTLSVDSLSISDTLYNAKGLKLVPGSLTLRTNEGTTYKQFSDAYDSDAGWYTVNGLDTIIRINFGSGATATTRGKLSYNSRPSVFNNTCIVMATYRVVVYAPYNSLINFKTGALTYYDLATTVLSNITFPKNNLIVFQSPGLCPNAVSATNALGAEWNGTFGAPTGSAPLARNRGTSPYTSYLYAPFNASGGPQDYYYGITNNTSSKFTTVNTWDKPDAGGYRVFQLWDITGDHTGTNNTQGNVPCDTTKPYNAVTNPCGYMLVVNSSYRADTAFTYTVNNLCPNTYYEISAWFKNICYKCGCDSAGRSATTTGYIPTALGDSSGVRPNIAFDVNGMDYYTTGNLLYKGTTPTGSDATNQWQKRGFVYLTGPSETSFTLTLRNNAPGGGGNDWALDDISVATCLPNMQYSPSLNPTTCNNNIVIINDTIRSYFNNYTYYKWQRSIDNGSTWNDISGANGQETPYWNGSSWQYITSYTVPQANTTVTNNGDKYRVVVATTSSNIGNGNCQVTDGISTINLNVIDCGHTLATKLLSFTGKLVSSNARLSWSTTQEMEKLSFEIEKSTDGLRFVKLGTVNGYYNNAANNVYAFTDTTLLSGKAHYRLAMVTTDGKKSYSPAIQLTNNNEVFALGNVVNPFRETVSFSVTVAKDSKVEVALVNQAGLVLKQQSYPLRSGANALSLQQLGNLPSGIYILQVRSDDKIINQKVMKK